MDDSLLLIENLPNDQTKYDEGIAAEPSRRDTETVFGSKVTARSILKYYIFPDPYPEEDNEPFIDILDYSALSALRAALAAEKQVDLLQICVLNFLLDDVIDTATLHASLSLIRWNMIPGMQVLLNLILSDQSSVSFRDNTHILQLADEYLRDSSYNVHDPLLAEGKAHRETAATVREELTQDFSDLLMRLNSRYPVGIAPLLSPDARKVVADLFDIIVIYRDIGTFIPMYTVLEDPQYPLFPSVIKTDFNASNLRSDLITSSTDPKDHEDVLAYFRENSNHINNPLLLLMEYMVFLMQDDSHRKDILSDTLDLIIQDCSNGAQRFNRPDLWNTCVFLKDHGNSIPFIQDNFLYIIRQALFSFFLWNNLGKENFPTIPDFIKCDHRLSSGSLDVLQVKRFFKNHGYAVVGCIMNLSDAINDMIGNMGLYRFEGIDPQEPTKETAILMSPTRCFVKIIEWEKLFKDEQEKQINPRMVLSEFSKVSKVQPDQIDIYPYYDSNDQSHSTPMALITVTTPYDIFPSFYLAPEMLPLPSCSYKMDDLMMKGYLPYNLTKLCFLLESLGSSLKLGGLEYTERALDPYSGGTSQVSVIQNLRYSLIDRDKPTGPHPKEQFQNMTVEEASDSIDFTERPEESKEIVDSSGYILSNSDDLDHPLASGALLVIASIQKECNDYRHEHDPQIDLLANQYAQMQAQAQAQAQNQLDDEA